MPLGELLRLSDEQERVFLAVHEDLPSVVAVLTAVRDHTGRIVDFQVTYLNAAGRRRLDLEPGAERGLLLSEVDPGLVQAGLMDEYRRVVDTGGAAARVVTVPPSRGLVTRDREETLEIEMVRFGDGVALAARNITDLADTDRLRRELAAIVTSTSDAIIGERLDGTVTSWNAAAERMYGYSADEMVGQPTSRIVPPDRAGELAGIVAAVARGEQVTDLETERVVRDGCRVPVSLTVSPIRDDGGRVVGASTIARDVSDHKRAERELLDAKQDAEAWAAELARSNAELQEFAYIASHDLAEPLRTITLYTQLLQRGSADRLDDHANEIVNTIVEGTRRMRALLDGLLSYSRAGSRELEAGPVDLRGLVGDALADLEAVTAETGARVDVGELPVVHADPTQLRQVVQNLLANAVKFHEPGTAPRIRVRAARDDGGWRLSVADNGIGIDPAQHDRVFRMFQRLHGREEYAGSGVGLAVCKRIVERHGGRIWFEPGEGGGTTFHLTIPDRDVGHDAPTPAGAARRPVAART